MKKLLLVIAAVALAVACLTVTTFASAVIFDVKNDKFVVETTSKASTVDLFENFKGVMPGDKLEQYVYVKSIPSNDVEIQLFLRSLGSTEEKDLLSQCTLTVEQVGGALKTETKADVAGDVLKDWQELGKLKASANEPIVLKVTLDVPATLGNEYQDVDGELHHITWEFKTVDVTPEPEDTGDHVLTYSIIAVIAAAVALVAVVAVKKRDN